MKVFVNGEEREVPADFKLSDLLKHLEMPLTRVAVELNQTVVRRATWTETTLKENDKIEIVHFVGGG